nr:MAG TPA: hypothetical protein [Caudoviricetes sp.]DAW30935.1 MAG TPA: hypothetical protein [Caudoviricetes sp.]DAW46253.1 MAG TPA: hypothetical protein [Bacteriophage sp.]
MQLFCLLSIISSHYPSFPLIKVLELNHNNRVFVS